ncbi:MAG: hypothetical protein AAFY32_06055, partial [Pseudomonadota bacterium]
MRQAIVDGIDHDPDFEWRGRRVTRIENLSDIIFALALGMLVSSSQPPTTFGDLFDFVLNVIPDRQQNGKGHGDRNDIQ